MGLFQSRTGGIGFNGVKMRTHSVAETTCVCGGYLFDLSLMGTVAYATYAGSHHENTDVIFNCAHLSGAVFAGLWAWHTLNILSLPTAYFIGWTFGIIAATVGYHFGEASAPITFS